MPVGVDRRHHGALKFRTSYFEEPGLVGRDLPARAPDHVIHFEFLQTREVADPPRFDGSNLSILSFKDRPDFVAWRSVIPKRMRTPTRSRVSADAIINESVKAG